MKTKHFHLSASILTVAKGILTISIGILVSISLQAQKSHLPQLLSQIRSKTAEMSTFNLDIINEQGKNEIFEIINTSTFVTQNGSSIYLHKGVSVANDHRSINIVNTSTKMKAVISEQEHRYRIATEGVNYQWISEGDQLSANFTCLTIDKDQIDYPSDLHKKTNDLLLYEIAVTTTPAYSAAHGNTREDVLMSIIDYIDQVNTIYQRELGIRLSLVQGAEKLIFLQGEPNPFPNDINGIIQKNTEIINDSIGLENYDIGHLFQFGGGGLAHSQAACTADKAIGISGYENAGSFHKLIAHEIGHQLGASHTWNSCTTALNNTQRSPTAAMEPGSGTTIMSYNGICGSNNVSSQRDPYFHAKSIEQITSFTRAGGGNTCAQLITNTNHAPVITATTATDKAIPIGTPFVLEANAIDPDQDMITYAWDNVDQGAPLNLGVQTNFNPIYRSRIPSSSNKRYLPLLTTLAGNTDDPSEPLVVVERAIEFQLSVRDNQGKVAMSDFEIRTDGSAGPFTIHDNATDQWIAEGTHLVQWDVANTTNNQVDCQSVHILMDYAGQLTFLDTLALDVPNDGSHYITLPDTTATAARLMVIAADNIFFDISDAPFEIQRSSSPDFQVHADTTSVSICTIEDVSFSIFSNALHSFANPIRFAASDLPKGISVSFSQNDIVPGSSTVMNVRFDPSISRGSKEININVFAAGGSSKVMTFMVNIEKDNLIPVQLESPADGSILTKTAVDLTWNTSGSNDNYQIEISSTPTFNSHDIILTQSSSYPTLRTNLSEGKSYFWRVKNMNGCGVSSISDISAFGIKAIDCQIINAAVDSIELGQTIDSISSIIAVTDDFTISGISITNIRGLHSYIGDLSFALVAPDGYRYLLLDQECSESKNFDFCISTDGNRLRCNINQNQIYVPEESLEGLIGKSSLGNWELRVIDHTSGDGGLFEGWTLNLCGLVKPSIPQKINMDTLKVKPADEVAVNNAVLSFIDDDSPADQLKYIITALPINGHLVLGMDTLQTGGQFSQSEIDNALIKYHHIHSIEEEDSFSFYLTDGAGYISENLSLKVLISNAVSINEIKENFGISIAPNPTSDFIHLTISEPYPSQLEISLIDINGRIVKRSSIPVFQNFATIDIQNLTSGIWILKIADEQKVASVKIIINR